MRWYSPKRWFNLTTGIVVVRIVVFVVFIGAIIVGLSLWNVPFAKPIFPFLEISEVFPTKVIALFTVLATLGTLVLALGAFWAIRQTRDMQKSEKRERLLNEIIQWAEEINNASLTPDISPRIKQREAKVLMRYGNSLIKAISILAIVEERFKKELLENVQEVINTLAKFMCIKQLKLFGVMPTKEGFPETVIKKMEQEIAEGEKSIDELWDEYAKELANSVRSLLIEANKIKAREE